MKTDENNYGFTLIELLITVAIFAIGLGLAAPSFQSVIQNNRSINLSNDLISSIHIARSEAIKRGVSVSICPASNQNFNSCGSNWSQGWIIFVNPDENSTFANDATEPLIRIQQINTQTANITPSPAGSIITYTSRGFANATTSNTSFTVLSNGCSGNNGRQISISTTGRPIATMISCS